MNLYAYVGNDPLNATDPTGMYNENSYVKLRGSGASHEQAMAMHAAATPDRLPTLDEVQTGLDVAGFWGPAGPFADTANTGISAARGNWGDATNNAIAIIPIFGDGTKLRKMADKAMSKVPGRVQSRINISNQGFVDAMRKHADGRPNKSQFSIGQTEIRNLLSDKNVVGAKVTPLESGNFV